jgi:hypothetical protein
MIMDEINIEMKGLSSKIIVINKELISNILLMKSLITVWLCCLHSF